MEDILKWIVIERHIKVSLALCISWGWAFYYKNVKKIRKQLKIEFIMKTKFFRPRMNNKISSKEASYRNMEFSELMICTDIEDFKNRVLGIINPLGYTDFSVIVPSEVDDKIITTLPEEVLDFKRQHDFFNQDLILEYVLYGAVEIFQSDVEEYIGRSPFSSKLIKLNQKYFEFLRRLYFYNGYHVTSYFGKKENKVIFSFYAKDKNSKEFFNEAKNCRTIILLAVEMIVAFGSKIFSNYFLKQPNFDTEKLDQNMVNLIKVLGEDGLMLNQAAERLHMAIDTASKKVANIKKLLGATTMANMVYLAFVNGLIGDQKGSPRITK